MSLSTDMLVTSGFSRNSRNGTRERRARRALVSEKTRRPSSSWLAFTQPASCRLQMVTQAATSGDPESTIRLSLAPSSRIAPVRNVRTTSPMRDINSLIRKCSNHSRMRRKCPQDPGQLAKPLADVASWPSLKRLPEPSRPERRENGADRLGPTSQRLSEEQISPEPPRTSAGTGAKRPRHCRARPQSSFPPRHPRSPGSAG